MARPLPASLTEAAWNKNKGTIAKMAGETGIGAELKKVEGLYHKINWTVLDAHAAMENVKNATDMDKAVQAAAKHYADTVTPLRVQLGKTETLANKVAADFKKKPLIPKASRDYVLSIATAATQFETDLKHLDDEVKAFESAAPMTTLLGKDWFAHLKSLNWDENAETKLFYTHRAFGRIGNGPQVPVLEKMQEAMKKEATEFGKLKKELLTWEKRSATKEQAKKFSQIWYAAAGCFQLMKPGARGILTEWMDYQGRNAIKDERHPDYDETAKEEAGKLGQFLMKQENLLNPMEDAVDHLN